MAAQGKSSPCAFHKVIVNTAGIVHGDDFIFVGPESGLLKLKSEAEKKHNIMCQMLGPGYSKEIIVLNRRIRWDDFGIVYIPDE